MSNYYIFIFLIIIIYKNEAEKKNPGCMAGKCRD